MVKKRATAARKSPPRKKAAKKPAAKKKRTARKKAPGKKAPRKKVSKPVAKKKPAKPAAKKASKKKPAAKPRPPADPLPTADVVEMTRHAEWSISQLWLNTGFARETIRKAIADCGVQACGKRGGYPVYRPIDVLPVLYHGQDGTVDPDKMKPFDRRAFYQGELDKLKLQTERGELVPSFEVEAQLSRIFKVLTQHLDTLPDVLERDVGATSRQLDHIERAIDATRDAMYSELIEDSDAGSTAEERT